MELEGISEVFPAGDDAVMDVHSIAYAETLSYPGLGTMGAAISGPLYFDLSRPPKRRVPVGASNMRGKVSQGQIG